MLLDIVEYVNFLDTPYTGLSASHSVSLLMVASGYCSLFRHGPFGPWTHVSFPTTDCVLVLVLLQLKKSLDGTHVTVVWQKTL